jgi:hypothetical protein
VTMKRKAAGAVTRRVLVIVVSGLAAGCGSGSAGSQISTTTSCTQWLRSSPQAQAAYVEAGTNPPVSTAFARVAAQYGGAICHDSPNSAVPTAEDMVNLATASGHTNLYGSP